MIPSYRVLIVDDEESSYQFVADLLSRAKDEHYELGWMPDPAQVHAHLKTQTYDVCILDYNLGGANGLTLMQSLQASGCRVPFILLTGYGSHDVDMNALEAGAAEYLDKSQLKPVLLSRAIRYAVKQQRDKNQLEDLYKQVQELEQLKTDMIRIAAHDLRTPLMTMLNYAKFLADDQEAPLKDYQQSYVREMIQGVWRMQQIIGDILSLERIQETAADRYEQPLDLAALVAEEAAASIDKTREIAYQLSLPETPIPIRGDAPQLREAVHNLIGNAFKYTPNGGSVSVSVAIEDGMAVFRVQDSGYGIPPEMQTRLFQPFYRAKSRETRSISGTGLGLYLVRNIVKRHGGEIVFSSVYQQGSQFGFRLPLRDAR